MPGKKRSEDFKMMLFHCCWIENIHTADGRVYGWLRFMNLQFLWLLFFCACCHSIRFNSIPFHISLCLALRFLNARPRLSYLFDLNSAILSVVYVKINNVCVILFVSPWLQLSFWLETLCDLVSTVIAPNVCVSIMSVLYIFAYKKNIQCDVLLNSLFSSSSPACDFWQHESESASIQ